ncbi:hypothetical protein QF038_001532 [Pseudarthrobacter sp. W1I19]|uniref:TolB family protein n=1 Tax=Pseudarthrobacter sp. W1I19 TaxID=3042288 RepID=UPI002785E979|nr:hypothetical protein [Pseudarthrobacter sp. W1I19]MDQ0923024.1 hypothetical protein [Pseudarthrobacter sp. W1I19]
MSRTRVDAATRRRNPGANASHGHGSTGLETPGTGSRRRLALLLAVATLVLAGAGAYGLSAFQQEQAGREAASTVRVVSATSLPAEPFVMFRNTAPGRGYGQAATVALADPSGERALSGQPCDRVYASKEVVSCLQTINDVPTKYEAATYDSSLRRLDAWALGGIPSRTRLSGDNSLIATTVFVAGHSYASAGFSTETVIRGRDGAVHGNLEEFSLILDGTRIKASDRNIWGVTFAPGDPAGFYATASSQGHIWLVRGDLTARTLTVVASGVECPSISPDGSRIAFKKSTTGTLVGRRNIAVLDLAAGTETVLGEERDIDDQLEWLDNNTVAYGVPRDDTGQDSDVWAISTEAGAAPRLFIEHAWSPAVVR